MGKKFGNIDNLSYISCIKIERYDNIKINNSRG